MEPYIYGRKHVHVDTDHKPLEMIVRKHLNTAQKTLEFMLLWLRKYSLDIKYKNRQHMYLANTLSHAYLPEADISSIFQDVVEFDLSTDLVLILRRIEQSVHLLRDELGLQELRRTIFTGLARHQDRIIRCSARPLQLSR